MISIPAVSPSRSSTASAARMMARACISGISGYIMASRQPRVPSIGLSSCSFFTWASSARSLASSAWSPPVSSSRCTFSAWSRWLGRNSCSGGSSSRTVTGRPFMAVKMPSKSFCCIGRISSRALARSSESSAKIIFRTAGSRSAAMNMCSVRHKPMPSAPNSRALLASSKLSALARTPIVRTSSAQATTRWKSSLMRGGISFRASPKTSPVVPLRVMTSPSLKTWSPMVRVRASMSMTIAVAPATQGLPKPRATTAAWLVMPPCAVRMPWATSTPWMSSGVVS